MAFDMRVGKEYLQWRTRAHGPRRHVWRSVNPRLLGTGCFTVQDLDPLATLSKLQHLSLHGNPVVTKPNYRCVRYRQSSLGHHPVVWYS